MRLPLAVSFVIHGAAFALLMTAPAIELPRRSESEYKQAIAGHEEKIVWYKFPRQLPDVSPPKRMETPRLPLRASAEAKQAIVSSPRNAPARPQMVWTPAPELKDAKPIESPNLLALSLPPPPPKPFVAP